MGTTNIYNVTWHFEAAGKIISGGVYEASVSAAAQDYTSIVAVLTNNATALAGSGRPTVWPGGTLVIDSVGADPSGSQTIFT